MKKFLSLLIVFSAYLNTGNMYAQGKRFCAESHRQNNARTAAATVNQQRLMHKYDVKFYKLDVALERTSTYIAGNTLIKAQTVLPLDTFAFELHQDLNLDSVLLNGQKRTFTRNNGMVFIKLPAAIAIGNPVNALVYYKGTPPAAASAAIGAGMSSAVSPSWGNRVTWSLSQPFSAYEWFPCKQILTDKADSSEVWVTTSNTNKVGSNGLLKNTVSLANNKVRYEWKSRYAIDYYLISVAVSDYIEYNLVANPVGAPNPVLIQNYIYSNPATLTQYQNDINDTKPLVEKYSELFGLYPFHKEKYGHSMAPFSGGMEHQTMTTQGLFDFTLTAHELAHQWFGDNVTCGSWQDVWLNEGWASYAEYLALEKLRNGQQRSWMDNTHAAVLTQNSGSVYVPAIDSLNVSRIFSSVFTYDKGAAVAHMLRFELNSDTLFFRTIRRYQALYKNSTAKTPDLKAAAEFVSGRNLTAFFNQWVYGEGYPTFSLNWNQVGKKFILKSSQTVSQANVTPFFETDVEFKITRSIGDTIIRVRQTQPVQYYTITLNGTVSGVQTDPNQWILNKQGTVAKDNNLISGVKDDQEKQAILVFPNPAVDFVEISGLGFVPEKFEIINAIGQKVKSGKLSVATRKIEVANLAKGTYVLRISNQEKISNATFQKN
jgi:aminopeptidase N